MVLQTLTRQERKQGVAGSRYIAEKDYYEQAMNSAFNNLLVRKLVLMKILLEMASTGRGYMLVSGLYRGYLFLFKLVDCIQHPYGWLSLQSSHDPPCLGTGTYHTDISVE